MAKVANGVTGGLIERAAEVALKERRKLIVVPRETPLSIPYIENMLKISRAGAVVLPASPGFYNRPGNIEELVDMVVARILGQLGIRSDLVKTLGRTVMAISDLRTYVRVLENAGLLKRVSVEVDPELEVSEIAQRLVREDGPAVLFENVKGSSYPIAINLMASLERIELGLGRHPGADRRGAGQFGGGVDAAHAASGVAQQVASTEDGQYTT